MPTYGKENFKESNVNYLNKDFTALKASLMNYAKSYFPNTYRDFNETSPGMMLLEMNAYVGDVLSFYIDQQYKEMLLPLAEERRNIITMAKMFGYKVKPIVPSYVDLTFTSEVNADSGDVSKVDYTDGGTFDEGIEIAASSDSNVIFSTLEPIDFRITGSNDTETIGTTDGSGLASSYTLSRTVRAVSATEKSITVKVGIPEKFRKITIADTNVVDIISCIDSNGQEWYEVDFLAQDKVPISTHYTNDVNRESAYVDMAGNSSTEAVPYSLTYITTTKRFTRETNSDNTTSLIFGNGVLKDGNLVDDNYIDREQIGIIIPGQTNDLNSSIDPLMGDEYSTLGETPNNTTLTITYRVGGGIDSNIVSGDISNTPTITAQSGNTSATLTSVNNSSPARGGKDEEDTIEIKEKAKAFFSTQNRCVTKEDYEARTLNIPGKFGNIAKVYVTRSAVGEGVNYSAVYNDLVATTDNSFVSNNNFLNNIENLDNSHNNINMARIEEIRDLGVIQLRNDAVDMQSAGDSPDDIFFFMIAGLNTIMSDLNSLVTNMENLLRGRDVLNLSAVQSNLNNSQLVGQQITNLADGTGIDISTINIYVLGYDNQKQLVGNPHFTDVSLPNTLTSNIKSYLNNFKLLTDVITINDGYVVNFGVFFDVIAEKYANKQQVKINCIEKIKDYFNISKMQFNQPIYKSQLEFELMGIEGVRSIGHVTITQEIDYFDGDNGDVFESPLYTYSFSNQGNGSDIDGDGVPDGGFVEADGGTAGYGFKYNFQNALSEDGTIVVPPNTATPTVFELKNPNQNIQGRVR